MDELGYIAIAYVSGNKMAANKIICPSSPVICRANFIDPMRKRKLDIAVSKQ